MGEPAEPPQPERVARAKERAKERWGVRVIVKVSPVDSSESLLVLPLGDVLVNKVSTRYY